MSSSDTNWKYRESMEEASEGFRKAGNNAMNALTDGSWSTIAGLQEYNEKLIEITQSNINMTLDFFRMSARTKSPSELVIVAAKHARRQFETSTEQARELAALAQALALEATRPSAERASR